MPVDQLTPDNMTLIIGNVQCNQWDEIDIDSEILTAADGFRLKLFQTLDTVLPESVSAGADCTVKYQNQTVLTGVIDRLHTSVHHTNGLLIEVSGRDLAGQLLDCSVDIFYGQKLTLPEIIAKSLLGSDGIANSDIPYRIGASVTSRQVVTDRTAVEPGEQIWTAIAKAAEAQGQYVWFDPEGNLMIGNPVADEPQPAQMPVFQLKKSGIQSKNPWVISLDYQEDVSDVFSEIHVLGQGGDGQSFSAKRRNILKSHRTLTDDKKAKYDGNASQTLKRRRFKIAVTGQPQSQAEAESLADKVMHDANLNAFTLTA